jgi:hypothetical protein
VKTTPFSVYPAALLKEAVPFAGATFSKVAVTAPLVAARKLARSLKTLITAAGKLVCKADNAKAPTAHAKIEFFRISGPSLFNRSWHLLPLSHESCKRTISKYLQEV